MAFNFSNLSEYSEISTHSQAPAILIQLINYAYYPVRMLDFLYLVSCIFWIFYIIRNINAQLRAKRRLNKRYGNCDLGDSDVQNKFFYQNEIIVRDVIFFVFLIFETCFSLFGNVYGVYLFIYSYSSQLYPYLNCTLDNHTYRNQGTNLHFVSMHLSAFARIIHFSFSMMILLFGVSLLHLNFAAKNRLNVKMLIKITLIGTSIEIAIFIAQFIPHITVFVKIFQSVMDQTSFFIVLYIAKRMFLPAMNSRVIDALHVSSLKVYKTQKTLLQRYKLLINFFLVTFEIFILNHLFICCTYIVLEFASVQSCLYNLENFLIFSLSKYPDKMLYNSRFYFLIFIPVVDIIVYFNLCLVNLAFIVSIAFRFIKQRFFISKVYRYQILSEPFIPVNSYYNIQCFDA